MGTAESWLTTASDIEPRNVRWLWDRRWPLRAVTLVAGIGGMAKSQLTIDRGAAETRGELAGSKPHNVLLISAEDTAAEVIVPRLMAARADLSRVRLLQQGRDLTLPRDLENGRLKDLITEAAARLVILDPLTAFIDGDRVDTHKVSDVRKMLKHLAAIVESRDAAIVAVVHFHKGEVSNVIHQISGSAGFGDAARSAFAVGVDPDWTGSDEDAPLVFLHVKSNWGKKQPPYRFHVEDIVLDVAGGIGTSRVVWDSEDPSIHIGQVFGPRGRDSGPSEERADAQALLREMLADGPVPTKDVDEAARAYGITASTLKNARRDLGVVAKKKRHPDGKASAWTLELPGYLALVETT